MNSPVVCDASAIVALLVDVGSDGRWVTRALDGAALLAPSLLPFECSNVLRRLESAGRLSSDQAVLAHADLLALPVELWPYELLARRVWELRHNLSSYDASYVAVAELVNVPLITLDRRLKRAAGVRCAVIVPD